MGFIVAIVLIGLVLEDFLGRPLQSPVEPRTVPSRIKRKHRLVYEDLDGS